MYIHINIEDECIELKFNRLYMTAKFRHESVVSVVLVDRSFCNYYQLNAVCAKNILTNQPEQYFRRIFSI